MHDCQLLVIRLGGKAEQPGDEEGLANRISFRQPSHSALPNHVHGFDSLYGPPSGLKGAIALRQPNSFLDCPVILFDYIIEILALT